MDRMANEKFAFWKEFQLAPRRNCKDSKQEELDKGRGT